MKEGRKGGRGGKEEGGGGWRLAQMGKEKTEDGMRGDDDGSAVLWSGWMELVGVGGAEGDWYE